MNGTAQRRPCWSPYALRQTIPSWVQYVLFQMFSAGVFMIVAMT